MSNTLANGTDTRSTIASVFDMMIIDAIDVAILLTSLTSNTTGVGIHTTGVGIPACGATGVGIHEFHACGACRYACLNVCLSLYVCLYVCLNVCRNACLYAAFCPGTPGVTHAPRPLT
jgi:hypothetical protein